MKKFTAVMLAVMTVLSTVSFAAPQMADTSVDVSEIYEEAPALPVTEDTAEVSQEADLAADSSLGTLVAKLDFDSVATDSTLQAGIGDRANNQITTADSWMTKAFPSDFPAVHFNISGGTGTVKQETGSTNKYLEWTTSSTGWARFGFYTHDNTKGFMPEGTYTLKYDFKWITYQKDEGTEVKTYPSMSVTYTPNNADGSWTTGEINISAGMGNPTTNKITLTNSHSFIKGEQITSNTGTYNFVGLGKIASYINHTGESNKDNYNKYHIATAYVDNVELYYKAPTKITVEDGNGKVVKTISTIDGHKASSSTAVTVNLNDYKDDCLGTDTTKVILGWKNKDTGAGVSTYYTATASDVTIVPVYGVISKEYGFDAKDYTDINDFSSKVSGSYKNFEKGSCESVEIKTADDGTKVIEYIINTPANTDTILNMYLDKQITGPRPVDTARIKGIYYTFRLLTPDGTAEEDVSTYFTENNDIRCGPYFKTNWWSDDTETECYKDEGINGWHFGECTHITNYPVNKGTAYNGEWLSTYVDLENFSSKMTHNGKNWANAYKCNSIRFRLIQNLNTTGNGFKLQVKSMNFILADDYEDEAQLISTNFYDVRKGIIDVNVTAPIIVKGEDPQALKNVLRYGSDDDHLTTLGAKVEEIKNSDGTYTYRFYAKRNLTNKRVVFKTFEDATNKYLISLPKALLDVSHTYTAETFDDGENLVPNGDFSNPYYDPTEASGQFTTKLTDEKLEVTMVNPIEWSTLVIKGIKYKPNTNYYLSFKAHVTADDENGNLKANPTVNNIVGVYAPVLDGSLNINGSSLTSKVDYLPNGEKNFSIDVNGGWVGSETAQQAERILHIKDADYYKSSSFTPTTYPYNGINGKELLANDLFNNSVLDFQLCFSESKKAGFYAKTNEKGETVFDGTKANGLQYTFDEIVVKEMYPITLKLDETTIDTIYGAKDVDIILPKDGKYTTGRLASEVLVGWTDGTKVYAPGSNFALSSAEGITLAAVTTKAPITQNEISVRTDSYTGIRFKAAVKQAIKNETATTEIGYIIARNVALTEAGITNINDFTFDTDVKKVSGKAFVKAENINKVFASDNTLKLDYFTAVVYGIPENQYEDELVARPYVLNDGNYYYGNPTKISLKAAAQAVKNAEGYTENDVIESILGNK